MINLPIDFIDRTRRLMGEQLFSQLRTALNEEPPVSIRLNSKKGIGLPDGGKQVPWCSEGYYLPERPSFTFDPLFHAGGYYVQEASSMFLKQVLRTYVSQPVMMLDLCAAPGGKSTLACSELPEGSLLVANEVIRSRSHILAENLTKWGSSAIVVTNNDPHEFTSLNQQFDVILTDVPCSGEGMFRKDPESIDEWSVVNVSLCWQRQRRILRDIWPCLKPGGILIYSTCTYNREENEDNVAWIANALGAEVLPVPVEEEWNITGSLASEHTFPVYRFLPNRTEGEGLFMAVLRKTSDSEEDAFVVQPGKGGRKKKGADTNVPQRVPDEVTKWIAHPDDYQFRNDGKNIQAFPATYASCIDMMLRKLHVAQAGIALAELKGKDWQPCASLALSNALNRDAFTQVELTREEAILYLRKVAFKISPSIPKDYVLFTYRGLPIGFAKNLGNRANILYPNEWRIRSASIPSGLSPIKWK